MLRAFSISLLLGAVIAHPLRAAAAPGCTITVPALPFGTYDVFGTLPLVLSPQIRLKCPKATGATVTIDTGQSKSFTRRAMAFGTAELEYNVYRDVNYQTVWGDGSPGTAVWVPNNPNASTSIYARIPAGQDVISGPYGDLLTVTVWIP